MSDPTFATLFCRPDGRIDAVYTEGIDLAALGQLHIRRASHVEPDEYATWWADLGPSGGGRLGPFRTRAEALAAEQAWLTERLASASD